MEPDHYILSLGCLAGVVDTDSMPVQASYGFLACGGFKDCLRTTQGLYLSMLLNDAPVDQHNKYYKRDGGK